MTMFSLFSKQIFSNSNEEHVANVLGRLGLEDCFEGVISFETLNSIKKTDLLDDENDANFKGSKRSTIPSTGTDVVNSSSEIKAESPKTPVVCKPFEDSFEKAFATAQIDPQRTVR